MARIILAELVKDALLRTGCDPDLIQNLDSHATVQIDLNNAPSLYIGDQNDHVVIWSDLCEFHDSIVRHCSEALLQEIMAGFPYSRSQQLILRESEGKLQIYIDVTDECLDDAAVMADAIDTFFQRQTRLLEIIRQ